MQDIENLETLTGLEELWLAKNKITEIQVGLPCSIYPDTSANEVEEHFTSPEPQDPLNAIESPDPNIRS